jgi:hypothetical protein
VDGQRGRAAISATPSLIKSASSYTISQRVSTRFCFPRSDDDFMVHRVTARILIAVRALAVPGSQRQFSAVRRHFASGFFVAILLLV